MSEPTPSTLDQATLAAMVAAAKKYLQACASGDLVTVKAQLEIGVPVECEDAQGFSGLLLAVRHSHRSVAEYLLGQGAPALSATKTGNTALMLCADTGQTELLDVLHEQGGSKDLQTMCNENGDSPLMFAAMNGHARMVKRLLAMGAPVLAAHNKQGVTAVMCACMKGSAGTLHAILAAARKMAAASSPADFDTLINSRNSEGATALHMAVEGGHVQCVRALLEAGAGFRIKGSRNETVLDLVHDKKASADMPNCAELRALLAKHNKETPLSDPIFDPEPQQLQGQPAKKVKKKEKRSNKGQRSGNKELGNKGRKESAQPASEEVTAPTDRVEQQQQQQEQQKKLPSESSKSSTSSTSSTSSSGDAGGPEADASEWQVAGGRKSKTRASQAAVKQPPLQHPKATSGDTPTQQKQPAETAAAAKTATAVSPSPQPPKPASAWGSSGSPLRIPPPTPGKARRSPRGAAAASTSATATTTAAGLSALLAELHPLAEALNLQPRHVLGQGLGELSTSQLSALEDLFHRQLHIVQEAKERLAQQKQLAMSSEITELRVQVSSLSYRLRSLEDESEKDKA